MTEQEIISYLKENKDKGVAFGFMPDEVQKWCDNNKTKLKFFEGFTNLRIWKDFNNSTVDIHFLDILCLPEDFELKKETEGEWVEFDIRNDGYFNSDIGLCLWFDWQKFLKFSYNHDIGFTAFGGWKYENDKRWYMAPAIKLDTDNYYWNSYTAEKEVVKPAIPIKIRFWRISK